MRSILRQFGATEVTIGLVVSLGAWYLILNAAGSLNWGWGAFDLYSFRIAAGLLFLNLVAGAITSIQEKKGLPRLCLYLAAVLVLATGAYSSLFRFEGSVGLAEGEAYEPVPPIFRSVKKGALAKIPAVDFTVTRVERDNRMGRVEIVQQKVAREIGKQWEKIGSSEIRFDKAGVAPLVVLSSDEKGELERSYVKLDLLPAGKVDSFMFETLPYDFYLKKEKAKDGANGYALNVRRGKLSLFDGRIVAGQKVPVQSVQVTIEDERKLAMLTIRSRPGLYAFMVSVVLLALSLVLATAASLRQRPSL